MPFFRGKAASSQAGYQTQFVDISYAWIGLSTADITVAS
jgi:hypothetical protein